MHHADGQKKPTGCVRGQEIPLDAKEVATTGKVCHGGDDLGLAQSVTNLIA